MSHHRKNRRRAKRVEPQPVPESLERAFEEIEKPVPRYLDATPDRANRVTLG